MKITNLVKKTWKKIADFQILFCLLAEVLLIMTGLNNAAKTKNQVTAIISLMPFWHSQFMFKKRKLKINLFTSLLGG